MFRRIALALVAVGLFAVGGNPAQAAVITYSAPYSAGPTGGDRYNLVEADADAGTVTVLRANPTPGTIGCGGNGGFAYLQVKHTVTRSLTRAHVYFDQAVASPFTWVSAEVNDSEGFLASNRVRGPLAADNGRLALPFDRSPAVGDVITIDFGLQVASACPNVDGGRVTFPKVEIR